jgi:hypothetical protein
MELSNDNSLMITAQWEQLKIYLNTFVRPLHYCIILNFCVGVLIGTMVSVVLAFKDFCHKTVTTVQNQLSEPTMYRSTWLFLPNEQMIDMTLCIIFWHGSQLL